MITDADLQRSRQAYIDALVDADEMKVGARVKQVATDYNFLLHNIPPDADGNHSRWLAQDLLRLAMGRDR